FSQYDASKVMGLAAYGDPDALRREFASLIRVGDDDYAVDLDMLGFRERDPAKLVALLGPVRKPGAELLAHHKNIAATLQAVTDAAVMALLRRLKRATPAVEQLCIAGGVALNCVTNELARTSGTFSQVFIPCAPHDA